MISERVQKAINCQINKELYSAYFYLTMQAFLNSMGLKGFENWMNVQVKEEMTHADKLIKYLLDRGGKLELQAIEKPQSDYKDVIDVFEKTLAHEVFVTKSINELVKVAEEENDRATISFLDWYLDEQVEEEANVSGILSQLKLFKDSTTVLFSIDKELATRQFVNTATSQD